MKSYNPREYMTFVEDTLRRLGGELPQDGRGGFYNRQDTDVNPQRKIAYAKLHSAAQIRRENQFGRYNWGVMVEANFPDGRDHNLMELTPTVRRYLFFGKENLLGSDGVVLESENFSSVTGVRVYGRINPTQFDELKSQYGLLKGKTLEEAITQIFSEYRLLIS